MRAASAQISTIYIGRSICGSYSNGEILSWKLFKWEGRKMKPRNAPCCSHCTYLHNGKECTMQVREAVDSLYPEDKQYREHY